jgi:hypothetical protein
MLHIIVGEGEEVAIGTLIATIDDALPSRSRRCKRQLWSPPRRLW